MFTKILQYNVFNGEKDELMKHVDTFSKVNIISGNPEILYNGLKDSFLFSNFTDKNAVIIPDGVGTVLASKIVKHPVKEKLAGIEIMEEIIKKAIKENKSIYLIGAQEETLQKCKENLQKKYSNLCIAGAHNGYFDTNQCEKIVLDIEEKKPYAVFVAMGSPRQERFISNYMDRLPCTVFMGVGGSFDIIAGKLNRAPKWMINLGIEWLYRVLKEPSRIRRLSSIPKFILIVIKDKYFTKERW